jgi:hypothetical protein
MKDGTNQDRNQVLTFLDLSIVHQSNMIVYQRYTMLMVIHK